MIRGTFGQVVTYPAGERALLTVIVRDTADVEPMHGTRPGSGASPSSPRHWQDDAPADPRPALT